MPAVVSPFAYKSEGMIVCKLPPEEWEAYKALRLEALLNEPRAFGSSYAEAKEKPDSYWKSRLENVEARNGNWLLFAKEQGDLRGMIGAFAKDDPAVAVIVSVYVSRAARGRGVSRALMTAMLGALGGSEAVKVVRLTVNREQRAAVALYQKFGFEVIGEEEATMGDGEVHAEFLMERPLGQPNGIREARKFP